MNKYIELKKTIEKFLELRVKVREKKKLYESHNFSIVYYLYIVNYVVYNNNYSKFSNEFSKHVKEEIKSWGKWGDHPKEEDFIHIILNLIRQKEIMRKKLKKFEKLI